MNTGNTGMILSAEDMPRFELAKAALQGMLSGGADKANSMRYLVLRSIGYANMMIEELKNASDDELEKYQIS